MPYTRSELLILHYLKRQGGKVYQPKGNRSLFAVISQATGMPISSVRFTMRDLEDKSLVIRTYARKKNDSFDKKAGGNPLRSIELVDPEMVLPELESLPLAVVVAHENRELEERTASEPSTEAIILALLARNDELASQIAKLQDIVEQQAKTISEQNHRRQVSPHLSERVQNALTREQWEQLRHTGR